ncbi:helix-turn-helix domain-containing protein [Streptomyces sedi]|uniref:Helix-turn-helix transcriptional regulator n=1 Tax=Streptomyces sedi TaxID=555059 RepID=A0A5C4V396_9ACTN|nr:helix-turn-helix transcriptional regulator [Streptomyces sedi]TNM30223.1 helix-turn-helix transcriptional regulator [Streptomyces sedi]
MSKTLPPDLGDFLRSRRAQLRPEDVGLPTLGRRRVPGLRREELAEIAGISVGYYTRLEQGASPGVSDQVLHSLARALGLDEAEQRHLRQLARPRQVASAPAEALRPALVALVRALDETPALVLGRRGDVLVWNRLAHTLLAPHLPHAARPNVIRLLFLDPCLRRLFGVGWASRCRDMVSDLRRATSLHPGDRVLRQLVEELIRESEEFRRLWAGHQVEVCSTHTLTYQHPVVGALTLTDHLAELPEDPGQRLVLYAALPGSDSADALRRLRARLGPLAHDVPRET